MASAGRKRTSRTNRQPITGSSPGLIGARRYRPIRARISSTLTTPFASPKNSQVSETRRIRDDLTHLGLVDAGRTIRIADGAEASAGDLIICRANDHHLEAGEPGRALANGDVLRIEAITRRGIMVRRLLHPDPATGQRRFTDRAFRYDGYQSADLAYAVTGHSAQGATVYTGIALVTGAEDRQWLYPAMTRGTDANLAFVFTTPARPADAQPGARPAPELDRYERIRQEWEQATAGSRRLAIAADTELRRRHPHRKIEPLRSAEPAPASGAERQHPDLTPQQGSSETARMGDLTVQRQAFRAAMNEHQQPVPGEASSAARTPWRDAILQPPKPQITPSAEILQVAAEHDIEHEAGG